MTKETMTILAQPSHTSSQDPSSPHAPFRWTYVAETDTWIRRLWGSELFFHQYAKVTEHTADVVELVTFSSSSTTFEPSKVKAHALGAWLHCRFQTPLIAASIEDGVVTGCPPHLGCFLYRAVTDTDKLREWAEQAVVRYSAEDDFLGEVERVRRKLTSRAVDDTFATKLHLVSASKPDSNGKWRHCAILNAPHYTADGSAALIVLRLFLEKLADENLASPDLLPWGEEVANLPPTMFDASGLDPKNQDPNEGFKMLAPILEGRGPSLCTMPQHSESQAPKGCTRRQVRKIDVETGARLSASLKALGGFTVSQAVDAARHAVIWWYANKRCKDEVTTTYLTNLLLPIDCTRQMSPQWKGRPYYCSGTSAFTTSVSLSELPPVPEDEQEKDAYLQKAFLQLLPPLADQWRQADGKRALRGVSTIIETLHADIDKPIHLAPSQPTDAFTSLGILERLLPRSFSSDGRAAEDRDETHLIIDDFLLCTRATSAHIGLHTWSFRGQINLSVAYTDHYTDAFVSEFLDLLQSVLVTFSQK